jgi:hypothetical protein
MAHLLAESSADGTGRARRGQGAAAAGRAARVRRAGADLDLVGRRAAGGRCDRESEKDEDHAHDAGHRGFAAAAARMTVRVAAVLAVVVVVAGAGLYRLNRAASERAEITQLADSVRALRAASDECSVDLRFDEVELSRFRERLDSMHGHVRAFETEPRGVPAARYDEYLAALATYQDSTAAWDGRVEALQQRLARCRQLAESHNEVVAELLDRRTPD